MAACRGCGAEIVWVRTPQNKYIPCEEGLNVYWLDPNGKDRVVNDFGEVIKCSLDWHPSEPAGCARIPHWANCPASDRFRRKERNTLD